MFTKMVLHLTLLFAAAQLCRAQQPSGSFPLPRVYQQDLATSITGLRPLSIDPNDPAQKRIDKIISRLKSESTTKSLQNANYQNDFFWPGFMESSFIETPLHSVHILLSNRRTVKLYTELKALPADQRHRCLETYLALFQTKHRQKVELFRKKTLAETREQSSFMFASGYDEERQPSRPELITGDKNAIQMLILLAALFDDQKLLPEIEKAFLHPDTGFEIDLGEYNPAIASLLKRAPLFSPFFISQIGLLYHRNGVDFSDPVLKASIERDSKLWKPKTCTIPRYDARVSPYDFFNWGKPLDWSHGRESFVLFDLEDAAEINRVRQQILDGMQDSFAKAQKFIDPNVKDRCRFEPKRPTDGCASIGPKLHRDASTYAWNDKPKSLKKSIPIETLMALRKLNFEKK